MASWVWGPRSSPRVRSLESFPRSSVRDFIQGSEVRDPILGSGSGVLSKGVGSRVLSQESGVPSYQYAFFFCQKLLTYSPTDNFLSLIRVSDWLIFCCGNSILKVLCYLQILKNTKYVRIALNLSYQLINSILSAKSVRILRWNGILLFTFTPLSTIFQPHQTPLKLFKKLFPTLLFFDEQFDLSHFQI